MFNQGVESHAYYASANASANASAHSENIPCLSTTASSAPAVAAAPLSSTTPTTSTPPQRRIPVYTTERHMHADSRSHVSQYPYYAVGRGLRPGVYDNWDAAKGVTCRVFGNRVKGFHNLKDAILYCQKWWRVLTRHSRYVASGTSSVRKATPAHDEVLSDAIIWLVMVNRTTVTVIYITMLTQLRPELARQFLRAIKYGIDSDRNWGPLRTLSHSLDPVASRALYNQLVRLSKTPPFKGCKLPKKCFFLLKHLFFYEAKQPALFEAIRGIDTLPRRVVNHLFLALQEAVRRDWKWVKELCDDLDDKSLCHIIVTLRLLPEPIYAKID